MIITLLKKLVILSLFFLTPSAFAQNEANILSFLDSITGKFSGQGEVIEGKIKTPYSIEVEVKKIDGASFPHWFIDSFLVNKSGQKIHNKTSLGVLDSKSLFATNTFSYFNFIFEHFYIKYVPTTEISKNRFSYTANYTFRQKAIKDVTVFIKQNGQLRLERSLSSQGEEFVKDSFLVEQR